MFWVKKGRAGEREVGGVVEVCGAIVVVLVDALPSGIAQVEGFGVVLLSLPASHVHNIFGVVLLRLPASHCANILERCCFAFQRRMGRTFWRCVVPHSGLAWVKHFWMALLRLPALHLLNIFRTNEG